MSQLPNIKETKRSSALETKVQFTNFFLSFKHIAAISPKFQLILIQVDMTASA